MKQIVISTERSDEKSQQSNKQAYYIKSINVVLNYKKYSYGAVFGYDFLEFDKSRNVMTWGLNFGYTF